MATISNSSNQMVHPSGLGQLGDVRSGGPSENPVCASADRQAGIGIDKKGEIHMDLDFIRQLGPHVKVTVKEGDTLEKLLMGQGYSRQEIYDGGILDQVVRENHLQDPNQIAVGTELSLPTKHPKIKGDILEPKPKPLPIVFPPKMPWWEKGNEM